MLWLVNFHIWRDYSTDYSSARVGKPKGQHRMIKKTRPQRRRPNQLTPRGSRLNGATSLRPNGHRARNHRSQPQPTDWPTNRPTVPCHPNTSSLPRSTDSCRPPRHRSNSRNEPRNWARSPRKRAVWRAGQTGRRTHQDVRCRTPTVVPVPQGNGSQTRRWQGGGHLSWIQFDCQSVAAFDTN